MILLQANWVNRSMLLRHDNWCYDLHLYGNGNVLDLKWEMIPGSSNAIVKGIVKSFCEFREKFALHGDNYLLTHCLRNDEVMLEMQICSDSIIPEAVLRGWHKITWQDHIVNHKVNTKQGSENFFTTKLNCSFCNSLPLENMGHCKEFVMLQAGWANNLFSSTMRTFSFKLYNNVLGINSRVSHFSDEVNAGCTFCHKVGNLPCPKETVSHLFFYCPAVSTIIEEFYERTFNDIQPTLSNYFYASFSDNVDDNIFASCIIDILKFCIWELKLKKIVPTFNLVRSEVSIVIVLYTKVSNKFLDKTLNCSFFRR
jgi:hypothetical protein